jgi:hypothetical protein
MSDEPPWHVIWEPRFPGCTNRWTARLPSRGRATFATVGLHLDGVRYTVCLSPKGIEGSHTWFYTLSLEKAQRMIQAWARYHWASVKAPRSHRPAPDIWSAI